MQADSGWIALIAGAASALAGVGLAGWLESRRDASRRKYESDVRFHDQRVSAYAAFLTTIRPLLKALDRHSTVESQEASAAYAAYKEAFWRVSMLCTARVHDKLSTLHRLIAQLGESQSDLEARRIMDEARAAQAAFEVAAKAELGIYK